MPVSGAVLTLVDCAGSERRQDTTQHDSQGQKDTRHGGRQYWEAVSSGSPAKESAEINATIFALKAGPSLARAGIVVELVLQQECFRAMRSPKGQWWPRLCFAASLRDLVEVSGCREIRELRPPFRGSLLTRVLSDSFSSTDAMIVAIGCKGSASILLHQLGVFDSLDTINLK